MPGQLRYKGWLCEQSIHGFEATHPDFTGFGDDRFVTAETLEGLAEAIDNWTDSAPAGHDEDQFWRDSAVAQERGLAA